jgi:hypothetical protein
VRGETARRLQHKIEASVLLENQPWRYLPSVGIFAFYSPARIPSAKHRTVWDCCQEGVPGRNSAQSNRRDLADDFRTGAGGYSTDNPLNNKYRQAHPRNPGVKTGTS